ncbi:hypothetical protein SNEBB_010508 [Seison nebaliae]|nr:hypothetical protein SNEBB_010508 [Seison nebaliae]
MEMSRNRKSVKKTRIIVLAVIVLALFLLGSTTFVFATSSNNNEINVTIDITTIQNSINNSHLIFNGTSINLTTTISTGQNYSNYSSLSNISTNVNYTSNFDGTTSPEITNVDDNTTMSSLFDSTSENEQTNNDFLSVSKDKTSTVYRGITNDGETQFDTVPTIGRFQMTTDSTINIGKTSIETEATSKLLGQTDEDTTRITHDGTIIKKKTSTVVNDITNILSNNPTQSLITTGIRGSTPTNEVTISSMSIIPSITLTSLEMSPSILTGGTRFSPFAKLTTNAISGTVENIKSTTPLTRTTTIIKTSTFSSMATGTTSLETTVPNLRLTTKTTTTVLTLSAVTTTGETIRNPATTTTGTTIYVRIRP